MLNEIIDFEQQAPALSNIEVINIELRRIALALPPLLELLKLMLVQHRMSIDVCLERWKDSMLTIEQPPAAALRSR